MKPHINLLRKIVYFFNGGRGKPVNLFPAFVPETITIPNGFKPKRTNQKGYPMYNYISKKGFPRSLREYMPYKFRLLCNNSSQKINKLVISWVDANHLKGDIYFPEFNSDDWLEVSSEHHSKSDRNEFSFVIKEYVKK